MEKQIKLVVQLYSGGGYENNQCCGFWKGNTTTKKTYGIYTGIYGKVTAELGKALFLANLLGLDVEMNERA